VSKCARAERDLQRLDLCVHAQLRRQGLWRERRLQRRLPDRFVRWGGPGLLERRLCLQRERLSGRARVERGLLGQYLHLYALGVHHGQLRR
jgi:hypothetical protein